MCLCIFLDMVKQKFQKRQFGQQFQKHYIYLSEQLHIHAIHIQ